MFSGTTGSTATTSGAGPTGGTSSRTAVVNKGHFSAATVSDMDTCIEPEPSLPDAIDNTDSDSDYDGELDDLLSSSFDDVLPSSNQNR